MQLMNMKQTDLWRCGPAQILVAFNPGIGAVMVEFGITAAKMISQKQKKTNKVQNMLEEILRW